MGFITGCLKLAGSAALAVTGTASTVLQGMSDAVGVELGSELFGAVKDASFNGLRSIWSDDEGASDMIDRAEEHSYDTVDSVRRSTARKFYDFAQIAKKNGDMEKYELYMQKYHEAK